MRRSSLFLSIILALSFTAFSQSQSTTGNIEGRIVDQNGAVVPGVSVSATNTANGFGKTTVSDSAGGYIFVLLPPGSYKVEVAAAKGFAAATYNNVQVTVGAKTALEIALSAGGSVNVVDVTAQGQAVETTRTSISTTVDERRVTNLPTNGRNFLDFATLTPGIVRDPTRAGDLAVGGQKGTLNSIQIDGASSDNTFFGQSSGRIGSGRAPSQFSIDTVKEFQVNQNGFSAEYGRAAGAVINAITKSGTNKFSGSFFEYFRDESLNARNPNLVAANRARPKGQINQFGGTFGGPFRKDKAFFFGAYEGQRSNLPNPVVLNSLPFAPANVQSFLGPKAASYDVDRVQDTYLIKTDFNINDRNLVWIRLNQQNFRGTNLENGGSLSALEHTGNSNVKTTAITGAWTATLSPKWFYEFRYQFSRDREPGFNNTNAPEGTVVASASNGTAIINDGTFSFGRNNFSPRETTIKRNQVINNYTALAGDHTVKFGVDFMIDKIFNFFPGLFGGSYTFPSYTALSNQLATPGSQFATRFRQSFAGAGTTGGTTFPNNREYGFFVQDDWRASSNFTVNLGVRYDYQRIAPPLVKNPNTALLAAGFDTSFQPKDKNNIAPRIGMSYAFNDKTVVRGGYGIYYGRTPAIMTGTAHSQNGIQVIAIDVNCATNPALCPLYPNVFSAPPAGATLAAINLYLFDKNYEQPFTHQARLQFERELWKGLTFGVQYTMFKGQDLSRTRNANLNAPLQTSIQVFEAGAATSSTNVTVPRFANTGTTTGYLGPRVTGFTRISLFESTAKSLYHGVSFELNKRFSNRWSFNTSYTWSNAKDSKPDQTSVVVGTDDAKIAENSFDLSGEYARSDLDVRHRFVFSPVFETGTFKSDNAVARALLSDYILTGIVQAQSGIAYSALVSGDLNADGNTANDRSPGSVRNQYSTPSAFIVDMRVGRIIRFADRYKLSLFVEGFNIFNRANVISVNNTEFGYSTVAGVGRITRTTNFRTPRQFFSASPSFSLNNSSYNRELQLGVRFDF